MYEQSLAVAFSDSLSEEVSGCVGEFVEIGIDSMMEDGLLKDIPFISTAVSIYHIGKSIRERHHVAKLAVFLNEINKGTADETKRRKYREKFQGNEKFRDKELEYVMLLLDRYLGFEKPRMLAKLYLAYLDGDVNWPELCRYAEVIDRFLPGDYGMLVSTAIENIDPDNKEIDVVLRLLAMGLVSQNVGIDTIDDGDGNVTINNATGFQITPFGVKLKKLMGKEV